MRLQNTGQQFLCFVEVSPFAGIRLITMQPLNALPQHIT